MTVHLPKEIESSLLAAVEKGQFKSLDEALTEAASLLLQRLEKTSAMSEIPENITSVSGKPIWEQFEEIAASVPSDVWAKLPLDGAEQHDHYIYGTPKRPKP